MNMSGAFIYFEIPIFGGIPITQTTVSSLLVTIFLCAASVILGRNLKKRPDGVQVMGRRCDHFGRWRGSPCLERR